MIATFAMGQPAKKKTTIPKVDRQRLRQLRAVDRHTSRSQLDLRSLGEFRTIQ